MRATPLGPDTVELIFRDPVLDDDDQPTYDENGHAVFTDRIVTKSAAKFTVFATTEPIVTGGETIVVHQAKAALPVDADTRALHPKDAIRFDGETFEMTGEARLKKTLDGFDNHVRVFCSREERSGQLGELVVIRSRGGQDDDGARLPDGPPRTVAALGVDTGNTAERYAAEGTAELAEFTVSLPLGTDIKDGDWIRVRGRDCIARVLLEFSQHADRDRIVVLAKSATGGG
jgi:hypothetical protein